MAIIDIKEKYIELFNRSFLRKKSRYSTHHDEFCELSPFLLTMGF